jgi:hypothetical protein
MAIAAANAQTKNSSAGKKPDASSAAKPAAKPVYQYLVTKASIGYGYMIFSDGKLYINQPTIPGVPGSKGFTDTTSAGRCARLVFEKLQKGMMPPAVEAKELQAMGVKW